MSTEVVNTYVVGIDGLNNQNKKLVRLFQLDDKHNLVNESDPQFFVRTRGATFAVGSVYEIPFIDGKSFAVGRTKYIGRWSNTARVLEWQAAQQGMENAARAKRAQAKIEKDDAVLIKQFEPFCNAYRRMTRDQRIGFEIWILTQLRKQQVFM